MVDHFMARTATHALIPDEQWRDSRRPSQSDSDSELSTDSGYYTNALGLEGCGPAVQKVNLDQYRDPSRKHHRIHDPRKFDQELVRCT